MARNNPISQPKLGKKLHDIRIERGLTQLELREKSHVSVRTIQRIESGAVTPRTVTIKILFEALGENIDGWFEPNMNVENQFSIKTLKNMLLSNASESDLENALTPAWISGIIYLLMVMLEQGLGAFSEYLNEEYFLLTTLIIVKSMAAISFFIFTRGILSLSILFENHLLKIASYISFIFVPTLYLTEVAAILFTQSPDSLADTIRAFSIVPLGAISVIMGIGLKRLQDGMGKIAKVAGNLELIFGISYLTLVFSFVGLLLLMPLLVVEIVLLSKADQLVKENQL